MKKISCGVLLLFTIAACNNAEENKTVQTDTTAESTTVKPNNITMPGIICFQYIQQRDTVSLKLIIKDSATGAVYGNLFYNMFEKDDNRGRFKGTRNGDIIKADYTYTSEGTTSVREVIFRLKDNVLTEGFGEMEEKGKKFVFKDTSKIQYTQQYTSVDCKD
jgi:hypothetical protein